MWRPLPGRGARPVSRRASSGSDQGAAISTGAPAASPSDERTNAPAASVNSGSGAKPRARITGTAARSCTPREPVTGPICRAGPRHQSRNCRRAVSRERSPSAPPNVSCRSVSAKYSETSVPEIAGQHTDGPWPSALGSWRYPTSRRQRPAPGAEGRQATRWPPVRSRSVAPPSRRFDAAAPGGHPPIASASCGRTGRADRQRPASLRLVAAIARHLAFRASSRAGMASCSSASRFEADRAASLSMAVRRRDPGASSAVVASGCPRTGGGPVHRIGVRTRSSETPRPSTISVS